MFRVTLPEIEAIEVKDDWLDSAESFSQKEDIFETKPFSQKITGLKSPVPTENIADRPSENGRTDFLNSVQKISLRIERFLDGTAEKGVFQKHFKRACIEKSDTYNFLDPFEGQFNYQDRKIKLDNAVGTEEFVSAIADCLNLTISYIKKELPKNVVLPSGLKSEVEMAFKRYPEIANTKLLAF